MSETKTPETETESTGVAADLADERLIKEQGFVGVAKMQLNRLRSGDLGSLPVVVGLAGDYCVKETALDGVQLGYAVEVPLALTRFVELEAGDGDRSVAELRDAGVTVA